MYGILDRLRGGGADREFIWGSPSPNPNPHFECFLRASGPRNFFFELGQPVASRMQCLFLILGPKPSNPMFWAYVLHVLLANSPSGVFRGATWASSILGCAIWAILLVECAMAVGQSAAVRHYGHCGHW